MQDKFLTYNFASLRSRQLPLLSCFMINRYRHLVILQYEYAVRRYTTLEKENTEYREEIKKLRTRRCDCGAAVAILSDKLVAKDRLIGQQVYYIIFMISCFIRQ